MFNIPIRKVSRLSIILLICSYPIFGACRTQPRVPEKDFVHPGLSQSESDLRFMKEMVQSNKEPWNAAFQRLKRETNVAYTPKPVAHISVGPYGVNNIGGKAFSESSKQAYQCAIMWYITEQKVYADKAIEILNAWANTLWDFDDNNAKLTIGLDGPGFIEAAEILKHCRSDWRKEDQEKFEHFVLNIFYPVIEDFFAEANGNWDASMIYAMLCMGTFLDSQEIVDKAVDRFFYGPRNGGITKYIYPNGQIQETTRDWDHVQLGLGEFAKAAQVAWTQGIDFYGAANSRLALGYEYAARFLLGDENVPVYGVLSMRRKEKFRDIYESVYDHYHQLKGLEMPYTENVLQKHTRNSSSLYTLIGIRKKDSSIRKRTKAVESSKQVKSVISIVGAARHSPSTFPDDAIFVKAGQSIQPFLNRFGGTGRWIVLLSGIHAISEPLRIPSNTVLCGEGKETIIIQAKGFNGKSIINATRRAQGIVLKDLLIEGAQEAIPNEDPNHDRRLRSYMLASSKEGISFESDRVAGLSDIKLERLTVQNFTKNGVKISGLKNLTIIQCDFSDNGGSVAPGPGLQDNLQITHASDISISDSRFDTSPWGNGIHFFQVRNAKLLGNEVARNARAGIKIRESTAVEIRDNLVEGNDLDGLSVYSINDAAVKLEAASNLLQYNGCAGIDTGKQHLKGIESNKLIGNRKN